MLKKKKKNLKDNSRLANSYRAMERFKGKYG